LCEDCKTTCANNLPKNTKESIWYLNNKQQNKLIFRN
jgi:hypothetical protein